MPETTTMTEPKPTASPDQRPIVITYKGDLEYKRWLQRLAVHSRQSVAMVLDLALIDFAKKHGFTEPAPRRNPPRESARD
jgi:hypothetical protein